MVQPNHQRRGNVIQYPLAAIMRPRKTSEVLQDYYCADNGSTTVVLEVIYLKPRVAMGDKTNSFGPTNILKQIEII
jgi:hypothetical protein